MIPIHTKYSETEPLVFPDAIILRVLLSGKHTNGNLAVFEDIVEPGVGPPRHIHKEQDETFFFLEGTFDVEVDGKLHHMSAGDVAFIPRGTIHAFKNVGKDKGKLRYMFSPALTMEEMFRDFHKVTETGELAMEKMNEISQKHGQETVGPPL